MWFQFTPQPFDSGAEQTKPKQKKQQTRQRIKQEFQEYFIQPILMRNIPAQHDGLNLE